MKCSILLATYNRAELLRRAITSCLTQTYKDFELFIADDGSTDNTEEVVRSFNDKRIVYKKFNHQGVYKLRNKALKLCKGKYIAPMDDDDEMLPNRIELQIEALDKDKKAGCSYSSWQEVCDGTQREIIVRQFSLPRFIWGECLLHANSMLRRKWLENHPYKIEYDFAGDYIFFLTIAEAGCRFIHVPEITYIYYRNSSGISNYNNKDRALLCKFYINKLVDRLSPDMYKQYQNDAKQVRFERYLNIKPKVSIVMTYYKTKNQLYKTLKEIQSLIYKNFEIIIASDGDNSLHLERFSDMDIKYFWHPRNNFRLASVRNAGMKLSTGQVLVFLDSEVYPEEGFFLKLLRRHYENPNLLLIHGLYNEDNTPHRFYDCDIARPWLVMGGGSCSIRKINALKIGLYDENYNGDWGCEDTDWGYRAHLKGLRIEHDRDLKTFHQEHKSTIRSNGKNRKYFEQKHNIKL